MKLFFHLLATLMLVKGYEFSNKEGISSCGTAGGPHGDAFDDTKFVGIGQTMTTLKLCSNHRLDGIGVTVILMDKTKHESFYGSEKHCKVSELGADEHITSFEAHTVQHKGYTRISFVKLMSEEGKIYEAGRMSANDKKKSGCKAPKGFHLGGFMGRYGDEIDALAPIWVRIKEPLASPATEPPIQQV